MLMSSARFVLSLYGAAARHGEWFSHGRWVAGAQGCAGVPTLDTQRTSTKQQSIYRLQAIQLEQLLSHLHFQKDTTDRIQVPRNVPSLQRSWECSCCRCHSTSCDDPVKGARRRVMNCQKTDTLPAKNNSPVSVKLRRLLV